MNYSVDTTLPVQKIPLSQKNSEWMEACVDAIVARGVTYGATYKSRMQINYDLFNGIFDEDDLRHVTNPYGVDAEKESFPSSMSNTNKIYSKINLLIGEELKRPDNFTIVQSNPNSLSSLEKERKDALQRYIQNSIVASVRPDIVKGEDVETPQQIEERLKKYSDVGESAADVIMNYQYRNLRLNDVFNEGWKDALIAGQELYYVGSIGEEVYCDRCNPLNCAWDMSSDVSNVQDGDWFLRELWLSPAQIYDRWKDMLTEADLDKLLELVGASSLTANSLGHKYARTIFDGSTDVGSLNQDKLPLYHVVWKSFAKVGILTYVEDGIEYETIVDETYVADEGESIEWEWRTEIWNGYRVADSELYFGVEPIDGDTLPYVGSSYNDVNSESMSLVSIMKPLQYFYNVAWRRLELAIARDKGQVVLMDVTEIPKSAGFDIKRWMHYMDTLGVMLINPYECFAPGTKVIMSDFTIKNIEDIREGDSVISPDGQPRKVTRTHSGVDMMYRLQVRSGGSDQIVNSSHKNYYFTREGRDRKFVSNLASATELITENENKPYLGKSRYIKRATGIDSSWNRDVNIDPYLLGLWIGDGSTGKTEITNIDDEIKSYMESYADENGMRLSVYKNKHNNAYVYGLRSSVNNEKKNAFQLLLESYGIFKNKDIPDDFVYTTEENRLKLLAGLIDTGGYYSKRDRIYTFSQSENRRHIVEKAAFIARSLGFRCTVSEYQSETEKYICGNDYLSICQPTISLNILDWDKEIPVKIERKKAKPTKKKRQSEYSGFKVIKEGVGEYYGIEIDGDDHLFLLGDFSIVHNSGMGATRDGKASAFNQFTRLDLSNAKAINQYITLLDFIDNLMGEVSGISRQREGQVYASELVGNVERVITQTSYITEPLFRRHNEIKKDVMLAVIETTKTAWADVYDSKAVYYVMSDMQRRWLETVPDEFMFSDFDIFISDSTKDMQNVEVLKSLSQAAIQNGTPLSYIAEMLTSENVTEIATKLKAADAMMQNRQDQAAERQIEAQKQIEGAKLQSKQADREAEIQKASIKSDTDLRVAEMNANTKLADNTNETKERIEDKKLELERQRANMEKTRKEQK